VLNAWDSSINNIVPIPKPTYFRQTRFRQRIRDLVSTIARLVPAARCDREVFPLYFHGSKRKIYMSAVSSLKTIPLNGKDSIIKMFVKDEKHEMIPGKLVCPRVIQPRNPRFNVELGCYLKPIEEQLYHSVDMLYGHGTFVYHVIQKGFNMDEVADNIKQCWDTFSHPVAIGCDASRFDAHVSVEALKMEHSIYHTIYQRDKYLEQLLRYQLKTQAIGITDTDRVYMSHVGGRCSGDVNTSLGNCLIACILMYVMFEDLGVNCKLINNGDDCVIVCDKQDEAKVRDNIKPFWLGCGFTMKVEPSVYALEQIEFCQMHPVLTTTTKGDRYRMCRNPLTALVKDTVVLKDVPDRLLTAYTSELGRAGKVMYGGLPIYRELYKKLDCGVAHVHSWTAGSWVEWWGKGLINSVEATIESRVSFMYAFDLTPGVIEAYESNIIKSGPLVSRAGVGELKYW